MTKRLSAAPAVVLLALLFHACDGGPGGGGNTPTPAPQPPSGGGSDVCATAAQEAVLAPLESDRAQAPALLFKRDPVDVSSRYRVLDALWTHEQRAARPSAVPRATDRNAVDIGEIAVVEDRGDIVLAPNPLDLRGAGLRFSPNPDGGFDARRIDGTFRTALGRVLMLSDDDSLAAGVPFGFRFFGRTQTAAFVNSDGNITFEEEDRASTARNVSRLLTGPPRVSPFLADLDPSAGGQIFLNAAADQYTVTWCGVRGFDSTQTITTQATLFPDGTVEMKYGTAAGLGDAVVGLSPGRTGDFRVVDLSATGPSGGGGAALGERFAAQSQLDVVGLTRRFYETHGDLYDQLVIWTDTPLITEGFAYETTVANEIQGIGVDVYDVSRQFGSGGRLRSLAVMDALSKYPDDPDQPFLGENSTLSVLGQEAGHRWLAFLAFRDHTGARSDALLGRELAHWSFFFDSDASVMEGNDIEDLGGGSFRTVGAVTRYSRLDQYAMGLLPEAEVPPFFYVESPVNVSPAREAEDAPRVGVTFNGTRREVLIQDVVAVLGPRSPAAGSGPRIHRQAFLYLATGGRPAETSQIQKLDRIRRAWEGFFQQATDGRMTASTGLR